MHLAIIGAGGHGRVVADSAASLGWTVSFFDDIRVGQVDGWPVEGGTAELSASGHRFDGVIPAFGNNRARLDWILRLRERGIRIVTIIDQTSNVSASATIGIGTFLARGSIVCTGAIVGAGCIVNTGASVDHDCWLADGVHLSPGVHLSGAVEIGEASWIGTGSSVRNNIVIGSDVVVGVGSAVVAHIANGQTVGGVPARLMEKPKC